jgi:hypothetical protein
MESKGGCKRKSVRFKRRESRKQGGFCTEVSSTPDCDRLQGLWISQSVGYEPHKKVSIPLLPKKGCNDQPGSRISMHRGLNLNLAGRRLFFGKTPTKSHLQLKGC